MLWFHSFSEANNLPIAYFDNPSVVNNTRAISVWLSFITY